MITRHETRKAIVRHYCRLFNLDADQVTQDRFGVSLDQAKRDEVLRLKDDLVKRRQQQVAKAK